MSGTRIEPHDVASRTSTLVARLTTSATGLTHLVAAILVLSTVALAGQPIYANDTWIHLALGEAFAEQGPWLRADPHLFAAAAPPDPSSWLGSIAIYGIHQLAGFSGLRIAHALVVFLILVLAWHVLRRAGASAAAASAGVAGFILLSTYRLVQLRPDLFTIGATLALLPLVSSIGSRRDRARILVAAILAALWSNVHAAFVLGPALVLGTSVVIAVLSLLPGPDWARRDDRRRATWLGAAGLAMFTASLANPQGVGAHLAYFSSGTDTLALESVVDEWNATNFLSWPIPFLPPSLAAWLMGWVCIVGLALVVVRLGRERFVAHGAGVRAVDPALVAFAGAGLAAAALASRFLWLGIFALAAIGALVSLRTSAPSPVGSAAASADRSCLPRSTTAAIVTTPGTAVALALFTLAAAILHFSAGDWPLVSRAMRAEGADYVAPYPTERYGTHAIWFLADTGVEGRIFNDYPLGGFMSFWLSPKLQMASSGTMNVAREAMEANLAIGARQTLRPGEDYAALLDRQGFDLFLGAGYPIEATAGRPIPCTTRHLEHEPGWLLVFRNLRNAVYLRRNAENSENLERIGAYYARAGVPFDRERGFETEKVVRTASRWAIDHGVVPIDFESLVAHVRTSGRKKQVDLQTHHLAILYATLGLYERALAIDGLIRSVDPDDSVAGWRVIWSLIQLGRWNEAMTAAEGLETQSQAAQGSGANPWTRLIEQLRTADPSARATLIAHLPVLRLEQVDWVRSGVVLAPARLERSRPAP